MAPPACAKILHERLPSDAMTRSCKPTTWLTSEANTTSECAMAPKSAKQTQASQFCINRQIVTWADSSSSLDCAMQTRRVCVLVVMTHAACFILHSVLDAAGVCLASRVERLDLGVTSYELANVS